MILDKTPTLRSARELYSETHYTGRVRGEGLLNVATDSLS